MRIYFGEEGQGLAEYGWTIVLVGILLMAILVVMGGSVLGLWQRAWEALQDVFGPEPEALLQPIRYAALQLGLIP
jgi:Flp pilus assembly pilin Flp